MKKGVLKLKFKGFILFSVLFALMLAASPLHAAKDYCVSLENAKEAAILDLKATGNGKLQVATKADRVGDRWRVTIAKSNKEGAVSAIGTGSSKKFTGVASYDLKKNVNYVVIVTRDRPIPGKYPAKATVRFSGSTIKSDPPSKIQCRSATCDWCNPDPGPVAKPTFNPNGGKISTSTQITLNCATPDAKIYYTINGKKPATKPNAYTKEYDGPFTLDKTTTVKAIAVLDSKKSAIAIAKFTVSSGGRYLNCDSLITDKLTERGDINIHKIKLPKDAVISMNIIGESGVYWVIYDPDGKQVTYSYGKKTVAVNKSGVYTIEIANRYNNPGKYTLTVVGVSANYNCGPNLVLGKPTTGELKPAGDTNTFQLNGVKTGQTYSLNIIGESGVYWVIYDPDGKQVTYSYGKKTVAVNKSGVYTIEIANRYNNPGKYTLTAVGVSANCHSGPQIVLGKPTKGELKPAGDINTYRLNGVKAGQTYSLNITGESGVYWVLYYPDGTQVTYSYGKKTATVDKSGNYTIEIANRYNNPGKYTLTVNKVGG